MGIFDKLFGKKENSQPENASTPLNEGDQLVSAGDETAYRITRPLTAEQQASIEASTILLRATQLYMHYWTPNLVCENPDDPEWQNQAVFFWKAEEPFEKKSLPPVFETFQQKHFVFNPGNHDISLSVGQAIPWFGMPGLGDKHSCLLDDQPVTIPELYEIGAVTYIQPVELSADNLGILTDRENHFFLIDERITTFADNQFYLDGKVIPIHVAYSIGGIHIVKKTGL